VTDLAITALAAAALFSGGALIAYDAYSTAVWRRQFALERQPSVPEPTTAPVVADVRVPAVEEPVALGT
jgi:hypothetical protein